MRLGLGLNSQTFLPYLPDSLAGYSWEHFLNESFIRKPEQPNLSCWLQTLCYIRAAFVLATPQPAPLFSRRETWLAALTSSGSPLKHCCLYRRLLWHTCVFLPVSSRLPFHITFITICHILYKWGLFLLLGVCLFLSLEYKLHERNNFVLFAYQPQYSAACVLTNSDKYVLS